MRFVSRAATVVAATLLAASSLGAQTSFSIAAGATIPTGDTGNGMNTGYNATVGLGIKPPLAPIGLRIEGALNAMEAKAAGGGSRRILAGIVNGTFSGAALPMVYFIAGVGVYNTSFTGFTVNPPSETDVGLNGGAGFNFPLPSLNPFLEVRFHHIMSDPDAVQFIPITFGIKF